MENLSQDNYATEKVNVISNCLLGNYVNNQYIITDDIKDELVTVRKFKKSVFKNSVFCSAYIVGYGDVVFEVTFQKNTVKNVAMAELFVLENEYKINGYIQNTIRTKVGQFIDDLNNFIEKTYNYFNIELTEHRIIEKKEDEETISYINAKRNFSVNMSKLTKKDYNKLYRNYVTARLELLKKTNNDYSNTVLDKFNGEFSKIEKYFLQDNNYKALSELLDKCIEDVSGVNPKFAQEEKQVVEKLTPIVKDFTKQADEIFEKAQPKALNSLGKADKTRMEDIEREMYEYQQNKRATKEDQSKLQEFYDTSSSSSGEPKKEQPKEEKKQEKHSTPEQNKQASKPQQPAPQKPEPQLQAKTTTQTVSQSQPQQRPMQNTETNPQKQDTPAQTGAVLNQKPIPPNAKVEGPQKQEEKKPEQQVQQPKQPQVEERVVKQPQVVPLVNNPLDTNTVKSTPSVTPKEKNVFNINININQDGAINNENKDNVKQTQTFIPTPAVPSPSPVKVESLTPNKNPVKDGDFAGVHDYEEHIPR